MPESGPTRRPEQPAEPGTHTYHGPVFNAEVKGAQLAWNNTRVTQNQQIAPGFEEVARIVTDLLNRLPILGLPEPDARDAAEHGRVVLAEVARPEPDRGIVRRGLTAIKGALAELAAGLVTGANAGAVEVGKDLVRTLGHLGF